MSHWCRDIPRDEAVRAAEDNRPGPLPTLEECIERVTERRPVDAGGGGNVTGLRTERVTLEITTFIGCIPAKWPWRDIMGGKAWIHPDESVRVVEECCLDRINMGEVIRQRDAAIRERDTLRAERITQALTADRFAAAVQEADRLKARVAELEEQLESAAKLAPAANADGGSNHAAPAASGAAVLAEIAAAFGCEPADDADLVEAAKLLVRERDTAVAKAATGWLTAEERKWIDYMESNWVLPYAGMKCMEAILARSSPPEVVRPRQPSCPWGRDRRSWDDACLAMQKEYDSALAAAGLVAVRPLDAREAK